MTLAGAVKACRAIWDDYERLFNANIDQAIADREQDIKTNASDFENPDRIAENLDAEIVIAQMKQCKANFAQAVKAWRTKNEAELEKRCFKQRVKQRKTGAVCTRHKPKKTAKKVHHRRHVRAKTKSHKRKHRKTGRTRGWNMKRFGGALPHQRGGRYKTVREKRAAARFRRHQFRQAHKANNFVRSARYSKRLRRYWKPYPLHRLPKNAGWLRKLAKLLGRKK